jgi:Amt family ammonium transporter
MGGLWGALATGLFATKSVNEAGADGLFYGNPGLLLTQFLAVAVTVVFVFVVTYVLAKILDATLGLRVTPAEEEVGLDLSEHGEQAYS